MKLEFDNQLAANYTSRSQKARVLTEHWVGESAFCPNCGHAEMSKYPNNQPVGDFFCLNCEEDYELKSKKGSIGRTVSDGEYRTKIKRLSSSSNPNLFVLTYDLSTLSVSNFFVVPKHFFVPEVVEERNPLSSKARRAGWIGSNILLRKIPQAGRIFLVREGKSELKDHVLDEWRKTLFLREEKQLYAKGWLLDVMRCVEKIGKHEFELKDVYRFENELRVLHPTNRHVRDKIRQQLQFLRNKGYLEFVSKGRYRLA